MANTIADVIKYEGDNTTFIWKHPTEDFGLGSQLVVHESQEAVFYMNGQALDLFPPGRHTLETQNLPLVKKAFGSVFGGETPFHCEIYFINKVEQMAVKWGTESRLEYKEPNYGFPIQLGLSGEMSLRADDSRKLLIKVVGTEKSITQEALVQKFRAFLLTRIKTHCTQFIKQEKINIFEIDEHLDRISAMLHEKFMPAFIDYGVRLERFFVTTVVKPEEDSRYQRFKELHFRQYTDVAEAKLRQQTGVIDQETEAKRMVIEAQGKAQKRALEGYSYQDERGFDVAERVASNEAVGQMANMGIGLGVMTGVGGTVGATVGGVMQNTMGSMLNRQAQGAPTAMTCTECGAALPGGAKFCSECGQEQTKRSESKILCPVCGAKTVRGKFCQGCGAALVKKCPECDAECPPDTRFCAMCGHKFEGEISS